MLCWQFLIKIKLSFCIILKHIKNLIAFPQKKKLWAASLHEDIKIDQEMSVQFLTIFFFLKVLSVCIQSNFTNQKDLDSFITYILHPSELVFVEDDLITLPCSYAALLYCE